MTTDTGYTLFIIATKIGYRVYYTKQEKQAINNEVR
jgi:hypothetical protein